jgi:hypothetical protein
MEILRELTKGVERILARVPTGPDPPRSWEDECERAFAPGHVKRMKVLVSNDNSEPRGDQPDGDPKNRRTPAMEDRDDALDGPRERGRGGGSDPDEPTSKAARVARSARM